MRYRHQMKHQEMEYVALDLETTGLDSSRDRIVEIAALKVFLGNITQDRFVVRVNPEIPIPPEVVNIHGIRDEDVRDCPTFADIASDLKAFIGKGPLLGHRINDFDKKFLREEFRRAGVKIRIPRGICTLAMSRSIWWRRADNMKHNLSSVADRLGVEVRRAHSAEDDARVSVECYRAMLEHVPFDGVESASREEIAGGGGAGHWRRVEHYRKTHQPRRTSR